MMAVAVCAATISSSGERAPTHDLTPNYSTPNASSTLPPDAPLLIA